MKRLLALTLSFLLILPCAVFAPATADAADVVISNWQGLVNWATNGSDDAGKTVALSADITAPAGASWTAKANFAGTFDGNGHRILLPAGTDGLFAALAGDVKNLYLSAELSVNSGTNGILTDRIAASLTVSNVYVDGSIRVTDNNVGGFAAQIAPSGAGITAAFVNCINAAEIYCPNRYASGFVGNNESNFTDFTDCLNLGDVIVDGKTGEPIVAGFAGALYSGGGKFTRCINLGKITANGSASKGSCALTYRINASQNVSFTDCLALQGSADRLASESLTQASKGKYQWLDSADDAEALGAFVETWLMAEMDAEILPIPATMAAYFENAGAIPVPEAPFVGYTVTDENGVVYSVGKDSVWVIDYLGKDTVVVIPAAVEGRPVTVIDSNAFAWNDTVVSVTLPSSLTSIGQDAFLNCNRLAEVINLSSLVITAGALSNGAVALYADVVHSGQSKLLKRDDFVFLSVDGGYRLISYEGTAANPTFPSLDKPCISIGDYAFSWSKTLTELKVPEGVTSIGEWAFAYCKSLSKISLPSTLKTLGGYAFKNCEALSSASLPASVEDLGAYTFSCCYALTSVNLPAGLKSIGNSAFAGCESLAMPELPASLKTIGNNAFYDCYLLDGVVVPEGVTAIGAGAFYNCRALKSIVLPVSLSEIGSAAFAWCSAFADVYYLGTEAQWRAVTIGEDNIELQSANVVYSYQPGVLCLGDANGDGAVSFADIQRIYQHMSTAYKLTGDRLLAADANEDGAVAFSDIQRIYQHLSGGEKLF